MNNILPIKTLLKPVKMIQSREIGHKFSADLSNCPYPPGLSGYVHCPRFLFTKNRFLYWERTKNRDSSNFNRIYLMTSFRILDFRPPDVRYIFTQQKHYFGSRRLSLSAFFMIDLTFCVLSFFLFYAALSCLEVVFDIRESE